MEQCFKCLCCCFFSEDPVTQIRSSRKRKRSAKQYRLKTNYTKSDFVRISDQERKAGNVKAYCCPICTYYYNRILACEQCTNCLCLHCFDNYDQKNLEKNSRMKCPFCNSTRSVFSDYNLDPHSYFDTTNKGFLSKEERTKIDSELKPAGLSVMLPSVPEQVENAELAAGQTISQP